MNPIRAAAVQLNHFAGDKLRNLQLVRDFVRQAAEQRVDLIAFPEMCITGYWHVRKLSRADIVALAESAPGGETTEELRALAHSHVMTIGAGLIEVDETGQLFNSYVVAMPNGGVAIHRKLHCFISEHMASGDKYTVFDTPQGARVGVLTCYDNNIIENVRITALRGAEILLAPHQTGGCDSPSPHCMGRIDPELWRNRHQDPSRIRSEFMGRKGREWLLKWLPTSRCRSESWP